MRPLRRNARGRSRPPCCCPARAAGSEGQGDSLSVAKRLVQEAGLGLAPGNAFHDNPAPEMQGWLRWCFASKDLERLGQGVQRLAAWCAKA